jgi:glutathione S-transferase
MLPEDADGFANVAGAMDKIEDFKIGWFKETIGSLEDPAPAAAWWGERKEGFLTYFEGLLKSNGGGDGFLAGNKITIGDVCLFQMLHDLIVRPAAPAYVNDLDSFPKLKAFVARIPTISPGIKAHLETRSPVPF